MKAKIAIAGNYTEQMRTRLINLDADYMKLLSSHQQLEAERDRLREAFVLLVNQNASEMIEEQQMAFDDVQAWKQLQYKRAALTDKEGGG